MCRLKHQTASSNWGQVTGRPYSRGLDVAALCKSAWRLCSHCTGRSSSSARRAVVVRGNCCLCSKASHVAAGSTGCVQACPFAGAAGSELLQLSKFGQCSWGRAVLFNRVTYLILLQIMMMLAHFSGCGCTAMAVHQLRQTAP
jgi:hypothetical protein